MSNTNAEQEQFEVNLQTEEEKTQETKTNVVSESDLTSQSSDIPRTSDVYHTENLPERFEHPQWFQGYGTTQQNPMFSTSAATYGLMQPTVHEMPHIFRGRKQKFSEHLGKCGMYSNNSLNTSIDKLKPMQ